MNNYVDYILEQAKNLLAIDSPSGYTAEVTAYLLEEYKRLGYKVRLTGKGGVLADLGGEGEAILLAAHVDTLGGMVAEVKGDGRLRITNIGGMNANNAEAENVRIRTYDGACYDGTLQLIDASIHVNGKYSDTARSWDTVEVVIDEPVSSKEEVEKLGIRPGDMITPYIEFRTMANDKYLLAKAWDNRIGCAVAVEVLNNLKGDSHPNIVYGVGTVQEEVGCRGAVTTSQMINPSIVFALDVGLAGDVPGVTNQIQAKMGKGPIITLIDGGLVGHKGLRDFVVSVADELNIPYQFDITPGGATDAAKMHLAHDGAPAMSVGIASRYIHSHTSMIHRDDYENTVKLMTEVVRRLDQETVNKITFE